mmetsp:Transcript_235/g.1853  ORF Transcript_235/g.1853 Transcript_235/m.1853 type:complete len:261 (+) Transcript_235:3561-4343(+)
MRVHRLRFPHCAGMPVTNTSEAAGFHAQLLSDDPDVFETMLLRGTCPSRRGGRGPPPGLGIRSYVHLRGERFGDRHGKRRPWTNPCQQQCKDPREPSRSRMGRSLGFRVPFSLPFGRQGHLFLQELTSIIKARSLSRHHERRPWHASNDTRAPVEHVDVQSNKSKPISSSSSSSSSSAAASAAAAGAPSAPPAGAATAPPAGTDASFPLPSARTSARSFPSSSDRSFSTRSESASTPTAPRMVSMSFAVGEAFPPRTASR